MRIRPPAVHNSCEFHAGADFRQRPRHFHDSCLLLNPICKLRHVVEGLAFFFHELGDLLVRVHDRRVIAAEA